MSRPLASLRDVTFADGSVAHVELFLSEEEAGGIVFAAMVVLKDAEGRYAAVYSPRRKEWSAPGGGCEPGESARAAAVREVWEETGLVLDPDALTPWGYEHYEPVSVTGRWPQTESSLQVYLATIAEASPPVASTENDAVDAQWVTAAQFAELCSDRFWWPIVEAAINRP